MRCLGVVALLVGLTTLIPAQSPKASPAHRTKSGFANDGTAAQAFLPASLHMRNTGGSDGKKGPGSGSGLCVCTSCEMVSRSLNVRDLYGLQQWRTFSPGGDSSYSLPKQLEGFAKAKGRPVPDYFQVVANDVSLLRKILASGRPVGITYNYSLTGNYGGGRVKGPDGKGWWAFIDNNYPGEWEWLSESQAVAVASGGGKMWFVCFVAPSPPPPPSL